MFVTGSNSMFPSKDILTEFEGRGGEVPVCPFLFPSTMLLNKEIKSMLLTTTLFMEDRLLLHRLQPKDKKRAILSRKCMFIQKISLIAIIYLIIS